MVLQHQHKVANLLDVVNSWTNWMAFKNYSIQCRRLVCHGSNPSSDAGSPQKSQETILPMNLVKGPMVTMLLPWSNTATAVHLKLALSFRNHTHLKHTYKVISCRNFVNTSVLKDEIKTTIQKLIDKL